MAFMIRIWNILSNFNCLSRLEKKNYRTADGYVATAGRAGQGFIESHGRSGRKDYEEAVVRFEKKVHDLKISKVIAIQTAPQIRLIQNNDKILVSRIQSAIYNTIPLWKNQLVLALGLNRQKMPSLCRKPSVIRRMNYSRKCGNLKTKFP